MNWDIVEILTNFVEAFLISRFIIKYFKCKPNINTILAYILMFVPLGVLITFINNIAIYEGIYIFVYTIYLFIFSSILCRGTTLNKLFMGFLSIIIISIISILTLTIFSYMFNSSVYELIISRHPIRLIILFVTKFLFFLVTQIILFTKRNENSLNLFEWILILSVFVSSLLITNTIFRFVLQFDDYNNSLLIISMIEIMIIDIVCYYLVTIINKKNKEQQISAMTKLQLEQQKYFVNETKKNFEEMSKIRHDTKNYLLCIEELLKEGNIDKSIEYIQSLKEEKLINTRKYVNTQSDVVNAIINSKFSKCQDKGIDIDYHITGNFSSVSDIDISILLSNLLDNSIEACLKCRTNSKIFITICEEKGYLHIVVKNTINQSILENNPTLKTTKSNNQYHGFGTLSIKDIVHKYDGSIDFYEKNLVFFSDILLKINGT